MNMTSLIKKGIGLAMALLLLTGCAKDEVGGVSISSGETMQLYAGVNNLYESFEGNALGRVGHHLWG